ncbi:MAG: hypothetical protein Q4G70_09845 [Pseudomonadota bacterium]|nr:hypothetical protein [Pseudomonadota bacterium]
MQLDPSLFGILVMVLMGVGSFTLGRWLSRRWSAKRHARDIAKARARETRQQRRARERRESAR